MQYILVFLNLDLCCQGFLGALLLPLFTKPTYNFSRSQSVTGIVCDEKGRVGVFQLKHDYGK
jgi:hypothetical protein